jgi:hypothetical protein
VFVWLSEVLSGSAWERRAHSVVDHYNAHPVIHNAELCGIQTETDNAQGMRSMTL